MSAADRDNPLLAAPLTPCRLGPNLLPADGWSRDQWSLVERCHWARATSSRVAPNARCKSRRCSSSSSSDSASTYRIDPRPSGFPAAVVSDEVPTAPTRGWPKVGALSGRCPSRGVG